MLTRVEVEQAHESDANATVPALDDLAERGIAPKDFFADTAYNSGDNLLEAAERGVELMAPTPGQAPEGLELGILS
ncbi:MAG: hypothetical protein HQL54_13700 [Magnetococcales bacterium]|nr:hypothetical protein [Magnetococcales bacterium]